MIDKPAQSGDDTADVRRKAARGSAVSPVRLAVLLLPVAILLIARVLDLPPIPHIRHAWQDAAAHLPTEIGRMENSIVIVAIDDESLSSRGRWPWGRDQLAELVDLIAAGRPDLLAINILLSESEAGRPNVSDQHLSAALGTTETVLGSEIAWRSHQRGGQLLSPSGDQAIVPTLASGASVLSPHPLFRESASGEGFLAAFADVDGTIRGIPVAVAHNDQLIPSFAAEVFRVYRRVSAIEFEPGHFGTAGAMVLGNEKRAIDWRGRLLPKFNALNPVSQISAADILDGKVNPSMFDSRIVLLGVTATDIGDRWRVPGHGSISGTEVQSLFIQSAIGGAVFNRPVGLVLAEFLAGILASGLTLVVALRRPIRGLTRWIVVPGIVILVAGVVLHGGFDLAADITWPGLCLGLAGLSAALERFRFMRRETGHLREFNAKLVDQAVDIILTLDSDDRITSANASALSVLSPNGAPLTGRQVGTLLSIQPAKTPHDAPNAAIEAIEASTIVPPAARLADLEIRRSALTGLGDSVWMLVGRDVTRLRSAERRLDVTSERLHAILDTVPVGVGLFGQDQRLVLSNLAFKKLLVGAEKAANAAYGELLQDWRPATEESNVSDHQAEPSWDPLAQFVKPTSTVHLSDGHGRWICLHQSRPRVGGLLVAAFDETESKKQALSQNEQMKRAMAAEAAKGVLLANVSHELRTPLNAILGFSEIMRQDLDSIEPRTYAPYVEHIHDSASYLLSLVDDLLDSTEPGTPSASEREVLCDIVEEARSVETSLRSAAEKAGVDLDFRLPGRPLLARIENRHFRQIVSNLIANGIKFTPSGGTVSFDLLKNKNGGVELIVVDTGVGMSRRDADAASLRFSQARIGARGEKGYGLGLAIVNSILPLYGLSIDFEAEKGSGTTAKVTIPRRLVA